MGDDEEEAENFILGTEDGSNGETGGM